MSTMNLKKAEEVFPREVQAAVRQTFKGMLGTEPECIENKSVEEPQFASDVSGVIQIQEAEFHATFIVAFPKETICHVMEKLLRKPFPELNRSAQQGAGEFTNMIYGAMKTRVNPLGFDLKLAIPSVVLGGGHTIDALHGAKPSINQQLKFAFEGKPFILFFSFFPRS